MAGDPFFFFFDDQNKGFDSLYPRGNEGNADHHQVQNVEIVPAERAFVEEGSVSGHLLRTEDMERQAC